MKGQLDEIDSDVQDMLEQRPSDAPQSVVPLSGSPSDLGLVSAPLSPTPAPAPVVQAPRANPVLKPGMHIEGPLGDMMAFGDNH